MSSGFFAELKKRNESLYWFGWFNVLLLAMAVIMFFIDDTIIKGINAWIKPMKFAISITIYAWTFAWLLFYIQKQKAKRIISLGVITCMLVENVLIFMQAFRGTTSHFNVYTMFDGMVFSVMGIFIALNSVVILYTIILFFSRNIPLEPVMLWAWRSSLVLFLLGGISGGWMVSQLAHTVGAPDGGPGLPFVNWSTVAGDIRAAHFITLHSLQVLPLATFVLVRVFKKHASALSRTFSFAYFALCLWLHWIALQGLPLISTM